MTNRILTQDELKAKLHYNPDTGIFTRIITTAPNAKCGDVVGIINYGGYLRVTDHKREFLLHRLAWLYMTGYMPKENIDHINGIRTDNRWCNLREASCTENMQNTKKYKNNKSGYKGVDFRPKLNKWRASISIDKNRIDLGIFDTPEKAYTAYKDCAKLHFGEFYSER